VEFRIRGWNQVCLDDLALPDMVMSCGRKAKLVSRAGGIQGESVVPGAGLVEHQRTHGGRDEDFTNHQLLQQLFARCVFRFFTSSSGKTGSMLPDGDKLMLRRQAMTAMSGVFSQCLHGGGMSDAVRETMIARMIAVSFGVLWAVTIGLMLNGS
jgi:hypothetical protein